MNSQNKPPSQQSHF
jgi:hypothetical protein